MSSKFPAREHLPEEPQRSQTRSLITIAKWVKRCGFPLAILSWTAVSALVLWAASHVVRSLLILLLASLFAFALAPLVKTLQRGGMPRFPAILTVYLLVLGGISLLLYLIITAAIYQSAALAHQVQAFMGPQGQKHLRLLEQPLIALGIPANQLAAIPEQILSHADAVAGNTVPLLLNFFDFLLDTVIIAVISIYLLIDGTRVVNWLRANTPIQQRHRINFLLDTLQRVVGGYIRGQFLLSTLIGLLVGVGMMLFHVPYAILLGILAFILEFIPVLGTLISGAICVLIALTQGWLIALGVLVYFIVVHVIEGDVVGPRIVGKAIGLHPVVSLIALIVGAELFGIWGALFASPVAGVLQALLIAFWTEWRAGHPELFPGQKKLSQQLEKHVPDPTGDPSP